jgi:RNA polymerase sigma-70 factor (ECF subfamily)
VNTAAEAADWQSALRGDAEAFGRVFDLLHPRVYRHALRLSHDAHDAEDVLAAAFLHLWQRRKDVRLVDGSVLPWLLVTTTNLALNQRRGLRRYRAFLAGLPRAQPQATSAEDTAFTSVELDVDPALLRAMEELSGADRQLLVLIALEDYSLRAAAQVLGVSEQAARSRWQRLRRRLASRLAADSLAFATGR